MFQENFCTGIVLTEWEYTLDGVNQHSSLIVDTAMFDNTILNIIFLTWLQMELTIKQSYCTPPHNLLADWKKIKQYLSRWF